MNWRGDRTLPWTFSPFLTTAAVFIGEVLPVVIGIFGGVFDTYGAKEPIIKTLPDFGILLIIYTVYGLFFWPLYKYISWRIVALFAFVLAFILEKWVFAHPEGEVGVSNTISSGTILQFVIIYFLVLVLPYLIFQAIRRKWGKQGIIISLVIIFVLNISGLGFTYYHMVKTGWFEKHRQNQGGSNSSQETSILPPVTCPDRLVTKKDKPTLAYWDGKTIQLNAEEQNWIEKNCPEALEQPGLKK